MPFAATWVDLEMIILNGVTQREKDKHQTTWISLGFSMAQLVKYPLANAGGARDTGLIPGLGRSPGEGNGNLFQYSCLQNSIDRDVWQAAVHGVGKSQTWLSDSAHTHMHEPMKQKTSHWREQTFCCQGGCEVGEGWSGVGDWGQQMQIIIYRMDI